MTSIFDAVVVGAFGFLIGWTELLSRYGDKPLDTLKRPAGWTYVLVNAVAAVGALFLLRQFNVDFNLEPGSGLRWTQVLVAGFGAMAFFRSSIFIFKVGGKDVGVGPAGVLQVLLSVFDAEVDRKRAIDRGPAVREIMQDVEFDKASDPLPLIAIALMQNLPRESQDTIESKVATLSMISNVPREVKAYALGLSLMDAVGEGVLRAAVALIRDIEPVEDVLLAAAEKEAARRVAGNLVADRGSVEPPSSPTESVGTGEEVTSFPEDPSGVEEHGDEEDD